MLRYLLDTNICIYVMRGELPRILERFNRVAEQIAISTITLGEFYYGVEKSRRRRENLAALEHFVARLFVLPFDEKAAAHYGQLRAELDPTGQPVGSNDLLIGAHARSEGLVLVTNNAREFQRLPGVRVENWVS